MSTSRPLCEFFDTTLSAVFSTYEPSHLASCLDAGSIVGHTPPCPLFLHEEEAPKRRTADMVGCKTGKRWGIRRYEIGLEWRRKEDHERRESRERTAEMLRQKERPRRWQQDVEEESEEIVVYQTKSGGTTHPLHFVRCSWKPRGRGRKLRRYLHESH